MTILILLAAYLVLLGLAKVFNVNVFVLTIGGGTLVLGVSVLWHVIGTML